jgi:hypothetical protein
MRNLTLFLHLLLCSFSLYARPVHAQRKKEHPPALGKIRQATTVAIDCSVCPRALAQAGKAANEALAVWDRFRLVDDPKKADLIFMFSSNPYLGDYLTRKGPDKRPVMIEATIMTVIDPHTGEELWSDWRDWGSWRVASATKSLIDELRVQIDVEANRWTLDDIFRCNSAQDYQVFAFLTPEAALAKAELGVARVEDEPDRLRISSPNVPAFCRRAWLVVGADNKIEGFEVLASESDSLNVADVLEMADQFEFSSGTDPVTKASYFIAKSKEKKVVIRFDVRGHRTALSRVTYAY